MKNRFILFLIITLFPISISAQETESWKTLAEKTDFSKTPRYDETLEFCRQLDKASDWILMTDFGVSAQGRALPLMIVDKNGNFTPESVHNSGNVVLLIQACIHPGESEGKDAGMMFVRDLAIFKQNAEILDHVTILFIPIFNVDGHERFSPYNRINQNGPDEMGWRVTAQNLNLNRDFMKADTPEMQAWLKMINLWNPDFFIDSHTTDGADYQYVLTYLLETHGNMDPGLTKWLQEKYIPEIEPAMFQKGYPIFPYVEFRNWHDPRSGLETGPAPPMLSQGYMALRNRPGLLIETHMLKPYKPRVESTYEMFLLTAQILNQNYKSFKSLIIDADQLAAGTEIKDKPFTLNFETDYSDSTMVDFLGFDYDIVKSDLTGGDWFVYSDKPETMKLPFFNKSKATDQVMVPEAYIIPAEWETIIERLEFHGIELKKLDQPAKLEIRTYKFKNPQWQQLPYEGRHRITKFEAEDFTETRIFPTGTVVVITSQPLFAVIVQLLEPKAGSSLLNWGYFDAIFEQKEYSETYVMEKMAREMLAKDEDLRKEFEMKKQSDPEFMKNPWSVTNWFYMKTPWFDQRKDIYPVGRIFDESVIKTLPIKSQ